MPCRGGCGRDEISFTEDEFLDLSLEQARELKVQRDVEQVPDGLNHPDYSKVFVGGIAANGKICLCCGNSH